MKWCVQSYNLFKSRMFSFDKRHENSFGTKIYHTKALEELKYANYMQHKLVHTLTTPIPKSFNPYQHTTIPPYVLYLLFFAVTFGTVWFSW